MPGARSADPTYAEAIAHRVAELIHAGDQGNVNARLVDAATLARELGVERSWVYEHAHELHPIRLGQGPRARLRFNPHTVREVLGCVAPSVRQEITSSRRQASGNRARPTRPSSNAGRVLSVRPRGAS